MKTKMILLAAIGLAFESFSAPRSSGYTTLVVSDTLSRAIKGQAIPYQYDSVKLISNYKYEHPVSVTTQAYARVVYPVFEDSKLNAIIKSAVLSPLEVKYQFKNKFAAAHPALSNMDAINNNAVEYKELASNFLKQFENEAPDQDLKAYWYADIYVKVLSENHDYTAVVCEKNYFTGGFHDQYDHIYLNYDNANHQLLNLQSQLKPDKQSQLKIIAERIFRKNEGLSPTKQLDGYFFKNDKFGLPSNFSITNKGLMFFYDYYEIKPFAAGTTQLVIPFADLKDLVLPGSILAREMNRH